MFDVFVPTLGRSSLPKTLKCLRKAGCSQPAILENMPWVDACNFMSQNSKNKWFLRVDDDMFLTKWSLSFMQNILHKNDNYAMISFNLFDWKTRLPIRGIKIYNSHVARVIKFRPDTNGRIDKNFSEDLVLHNFDNMIYKYIVGVHADTPKAEQYKSWRDRGEKDIDKYNCLSDDFMGYTEQLNYLNTIREP